MKIFPSQRITFHSTSRVEEVHENLQELIKKPAGNLWGPDTAYEGKITVSSFSINRLINGRNSFIPVIEGNVSTENAGSKIDLYFRLKKSVLLGLAVWSCFVTLFFVVGFSMLLMGKANVMFTIVPLIMLGFMLVMTHLSFDHQVNISVSDLKEKLKAK